MAGHQDRAVLRSLEFLTEELPSGGREPIVKAQFWSDMIQVTFSSVPTAGCSQEKALRGTLQTYSECKAGEHAVPGSNGQMPKDFLQSKVQF